MPFDAAILSIRNLESTLQQLGINPISYQELMDYKEEQVKNNPPSWLWTYRPVIQKFVCAVFFLTLFATSVSFGLMVLAAAISPEYLQPTAIAFIMSLSSCAIWIIALGLIFQTIIVKGPAEWLEEPYYRMQDAPRAIQQLFFVVRNAYPSARFKIGKLVQDEEVLDPYLIVWEQIDATTRAEFCLGIWDDTGIIKIASHD